MKGLKASDVAARMDMKEATYTKYERGETGITVDFIQKIAEILEISPLKLLSANPSNFLESITNSQIAIQDNSTFQTCNDKNNEMLLKLMESVLKLNERIILLLEGKQS